MAEMSKKLCQGKDTFERINFLYQAACEMAPKNKTLSCYYGNLCKSISKKAVLRMEPEIKRTICKRCGIIFQPGVTANLNIVSEQNDKTKVCEIECTQCGFTKRLVMSKKYKVWVDLEDSIKEKIRP